MIKIPTISLSSIEHPWHPKEEQPPHYGKYVVIGLTEFTPDHNGDPDAIWTYQIATYAPHGWSMKIKCWVEINEAPKKYSRYVGKAVHSRNIKG